MSALSKLGNIANNLMAGTVTFNIGGFKINLNSLNILCTTIEYPGLGGFLASPTSVVQTLTNGARGVFCIGAVLTDPAMMLNTLTMCLEYIEALGISIMNDLYKVCLDRVNAILSEVYGIVLGYFKTIKSVISMIKNVGGLINDVSNFKLKKGSDLLDELFNRKNCDYVVANLLRCMIAKMLQPYIDKFKNGAIQKILDVSDDISDSIQENTNAVTAMSDYIGQQARFVDKFTTQVREIL